MRQSLQLCGALIGALCLTGCQTPMQKAVKSWAEPFDEKVPPVNQPELGHRLLESGVTDTNRCYREKGDLSAEEAFQGQREVHVSYSANDRGNLRADWTNVFEIGAAGGSSFDFLLRDIRVVKLKRLFFAPGSGCSSERHRYLARRGAVDQVITQAAKARQVSINWRGTAHVGIKADAKAVRTELVSSGTSSGNWSADDLYFAHVVQKVTTRLFEGPVERIEDGEPTAALVGCRAVLNTVQGKSWTGSLFCEGGRAFPLSGAYGESVSRDTDEGVTYDVTVRKTDAAGFHQIQLIRWQVDA